jgi:hypothetical protein
MKTKGQFKLQIKPQIYLWVCLTILVAIAANASLRWSLVALSTFILAYGTKGIRRSLRLALTQNERLSRPEI